MIYKRLVSFIIFFAVFSNYAQTNKFESLINSVKREFTDYVAVDTFYYQQFRTKIFYESVESYDMLLGNVLSKDFQSFLVGGVSGSVIFFEFDKEIDEGGKGLLNSFLWGGGNQASALWPDELVIYKNYLVIISFPYQSEQAAKLKELLTSELSLF